jgi:uncharacterized membrane protein
VKKLLFILISLFVFVPIVFGGYYADIEIDVSENGDVKIDGTTNYDLFNGTYDNLTSKKGSYWILNITSEERFDDFIYKLKLPKHSVTNYIKTTPNFRIDEEDGRIVIIGLGENRPFNVIVQYKIEKPSEDFVIPKKDYNGDYFYPVIISLSVVVSLPLIVFIFFNKKKKSKLVEQQKQQEMQENEIDFSRYSQRQQEILAYLIKKDGRCTQRDLEQDLNIPKASLSRNIKSLEYKKIIEKISIGNSNEIRILK